MSLFIPQGCVTASSASLLWTPVAGSAEYCVYCNGRRFKRVRGCALGVRGLLHDHAYHFEVRAVLGQVEMPCGDARLTTLSPPVEYDAARCGTDPTGHNDSTAALQQAIDACRPGGLVYLARGQYRMAGTLRLKSCLRLYMEPRAVLSGPSFVGSGLHDLVLTGGCWDGAALQLQGCRRVCLRDMAGGRLELADCRDITLDNTAPACLDNCRGAYIL